MGAEFQHAARRDAQRLPELDRSAIERGGHGRAAQRDECLAGEAQRRAGGGHFQRGRALAVANDAVGEAQGEIVHRTRGGTPHVPVAKAARPVLHGGQRAGTQHLDAGRGKDKAAQQPRGRAASEELRIAEDGLQERQVGLDAMDAGVRQSFTQAFDGHLARGPCAMIFASIGSYQLPTSVPVSIQPSTRRSSGSCTSVSRPLLGGNSAPRPRHRAAPARHGRVLRSGRQPGRAAPRRRRAASIPPGPCRPPLR